jgi:hypothetical protein
VECILTDAYFAVGERPAVWLVLTGVASASAFGNLVVLAIWTAGTASALWKTAL